MIRIKKQKNNKGFTLVETLVCVALFSVVMVAGIGALLNANRLSNKAKNMRSILDNLSFAMDDISKNIRTGYSYYCIPSIGGAPLYTPSAGVPGSGQSCFGISFINSYDGSKWAYRLTAQGSMQRSTDGGATWVTLTPTEAVINSSSIPPFVILGAESPAEDGDMQQPFVNIRLVGTIPYQNINTSFSLQTSVSQMGIDI